MGRLPCDPLGGYFNRSFVMYASFTHILMEINFIYLFIPGFIFIHRHRCHQVYMQFTNLRKYNQIRKQFCLCIFVNEVKRVLSFIEK